MSEYNYFLDFIIDILAADSLVQQETYTLRQGLTIKITHCIENRVISSEIKLDIIVIDCVVLVRCLTNQARL